VDQYAAGSGIPEVEETVTSHPCSTVPCTVAVPVTALEYKIECRAVKHYHIFSRIVMQYQQGNRRYQTSLAVCNLYSIYFFNPVPLKLS